MPAQGIGFAVLGGVFGEGCRPARQARLIGAFIATLGLPQFDPVNEAIRERMQERVSARATTTPMSTRACRRWCRPPGG
jgi:Rad3-related DNA helicase